jgi:hypothetical protein
MCVYVFLAKGSGFNHLCNETELMLKSTKLKRLMGLKAHHDGFKLANFLGVAECGSLCEIEVDSDLMI